MQEQKKMDLRQMEDLMKDPDGGISDKKETLISSNQNRTQVDSGSALQAFLNHIPITSIPGINNSPELQVVELNAGIRVKEAIEMLYEKNVFGAPIADVLDPDTTIGRLSDRYIGFIDLATLILWCLQKFEKHRCVQTQAKDNSGNTIGENAFFTILEQNPQIGQTKIGELAKSFLWQPFFPVCLHDTLFHVLLLLSKHRLQVVPVMERPDSQVIGFVTQNAVIHMLLKSDGLEWFDAIADKALSDFQYVELETVSDSIKTCYYAIVEAPTYNKRYQMFGNKDDVIQVYRDQSITEALEILEKNQTDAIAVVNRGTKSIIGCIRRTNIYLLIENDNLLLDRKNVTVENFIHMEPAGATASDPIIERDIGALLSVGVLRLRNGFGPRMDQPVVNKKSDTLKQVMKNLVETKGDFCFLVDDDHKQTPTGIVTLRDVIIQFAPPCIDSSIHGGGFFDIALEQTGCKVENGTVICDH